MPEACFQHDVMPLLRLSDIVVAGTPIEAMRDWHEKKPGLFASPIPNKPGRDS